MRKRWLACSTLALLLAISPGVLSAQTQANQDPPPPPPADITTQVENPDAVPPPPADPPPAEPVTQPEPKPDSPEQTELETVPPDA